MQNWPIIITIPLITLATASVIFVIAYLFMKIIFKNNRNDGYCCDIMKSYLEYKCDIHDDPHECSDYVVARFNYYIGIPIRDGGSSFSEIKHCPWCGADVKTIVGTKPSTNFEDGTRRILIDEDEWEEETNNE